ncbi:RlmE family RNA methyltransferase [Candidatus Woesearchaeota archaeon]|nr:RlmE family RNA methyltransferase [Candidatus Woesearchaeota archaeon]
MKDYYNRKARDEGMRARSAYKLLQINSRYHFIHPTDDALDLGCWPGGWLLALKKITKGRILGIDLQKIDPIQGVEFLRGDIREVNIEGMFKVVISDMAPKTTGMKELDAARSFELASLALETAKKHLVINGNFLVKIFQGEDFEPFLKEVKMHFKAVKAHKPEASKSKSKEMYIIALGFKG